MLCPLGRKILPWALLLLLLGFQPLVTQAWCSETDLDIYKLQVSDPKFSPAVEFALQEFNQQSENQYAYKLVRVLSSQSKKLISSTIYSMKLQLGRTVCGKSEEDIDDCPLQDSTKLNNVSQSPSLPHFTYVGASWHGVGCKSSSSNRS
ncbi:Cystatin-9 [Sciurus carolinensis]|uniref:Cystatin-9 n=1 Tax=Sciurus carolinensis TaxID=30640 RepID=A0AA41NE97_SCICA|nr:Cystatin-9 [Sciurus carolinensis]